MLICAFSHSVGKMVTTKHALMFLVYGLIAKSVLSQLEGFTAGTDYPIFEEVPPNLQFKCSDHIPGYYSDPEARCQVWHWCLPGGRQYSFLCPNGTMFNQLHRVCDWFFNVDCPNAAQYYNVNEDLYKVPELRTSSPST